MANDRIRETIMKIISADDRLAERRGVKALIVGTTGVGKTSLLRTLDPTCTLFVDVEAGDLAVQDVPVDTVRLHDWTTARDIACRIGGPNPSFPPTACYSQAHYEAIGGALDKLDKYQTLFVDSITAISRLSFRWAEQQPEAFSDRSGKKDVRGTVRSCRHDRRARQGGRDQPRQAAGDPRIGARHQAGRREPAGARRPHREAGRVRRDAVHRKDRHRKGQR
jgi:hypothetical protein